MMFVTNKWIPQTRAQVSNNISIVSPNVANVGKNPHFVTPFGDDFRKRRWGLCQILRGRTTSVNERRARRSRVDVSCCLGTPPGEPGQHLLPIQSWFGLFLSSTTDRPLTPSETCARVREKNPDTDRFNDLRTSSCHMSKMTNRGPTPSLAELVLALLIIAAAAGTSDGATPYTPVLQRANFYWQSLHWARGAPAAVEGGDDMLYSVASGDLLGAGFKYSLFGKAPAADAPRRLFLVPAAAAAGNGGLLWAGSSATAPLFADSA
ncbi:MAG: hypothetical protein J3K34DRAFT_461397 [Monoraphidium minutum]|nr:MAG: hypothetical protein J3K34DRAFT_461397 [Monoraphidium minutum]